MQRACRGEDLDGTELAAGADGAGSADRDAAVAVGTAERFPFASNSG